MEYYTNLANDGGELSHLPCLLRRKHSPSPVDERKLFFAEEYQLINIEKITELLKSSF